MFSTEFDIILFGRGINTLTLALECANQSRRAIIIELNDNKSQEIQEPCYIWDESLDEYPFLKGGRGNKISEIIWKGKEKNYRLDMNDCWKLDSIKISTLLKKELDKFNIPIIKANTIKMELSEKLTVQANQDTYTARLCTLNHNYLSNNNFKSNFNLKSIKNKEIRINNHIENVKGFPITNDIMHINNFLVETPGHNHKYQARILSNIIYPIHESGAVISLNWGDECNIDQELKEIYLNELCVRNWRRKRKIITVVNQIQDRSINILNSSNIISPENRLMMLEPAIDQLNFNFFGLDLSKSFNFGKIFLKWLNNAFFKERLEWNPQTFFEAINKETEIHHDMYLNAYLTQKLVNFLSTLDSEKIDVVISEFLYKYLKINENINLFLKGMLPQDIINDVLNNLIGI
ncbi:MAG: hypothetical protein EAX96_11095 [Candidatus Lokiarchaeota archaeon]|nr:hypothetical protein [Candidatus Lokiarchaeota archaeon]